LKVILPEHKALLQKAKEVISAHPEKSCFEKIFGNMFEEMPKEKEDAKEEKCCFENCHEKAT